ncbi:MAG: PTS sugar transporter subunit IIA [Planctomycetes bacterium]|nr:PTS sugar transporter subunit IIA [Planctomycetota bacterium]
MSVRLAHMQLSALFTPQDFVIGLEAPDKWAAIERLVGCLEATGRLAPGSAAETVAAVMERERSMSTGMERGLALPHASIEGLPRVIACMGTIHDPRGLPFESIDRRPARIVVLLLVPRAQKLLHIRTLAEIARLLSRESVRDALLAARSGEEAWNALLAGESSRSTSA